MGECGCYDLPQRHRGHKDCFSVLLCDAVVILFHQILYFSLPRRHRGHEGLLLCVTLWLCGYFLLIIFIKSFISVYHKGTEDRKIVSLCYFVAL